jgi:hypothetical protein
MGWFTYAAWFARDEILHFVQDDNGERGMTSSAGMTITRLGGGRVLD